MKINNIEPKAKGGREQWTKVQADFAAKYPDKGNTVPFNNMVRYCHTLRNRAACFDDNEDNIKGFFSNCHTEEDKKTKINAWLNYAKAFDLEPSKKMVAMLPPEPKPVAETKAKKSAQNKKEKEEAAKTEKAPAATTKKAAANKDEAKVEKAKKDDEPKAEKTTPAKKTAAAKKDDAATTKTTKEKTTPAKKQSTTSKDDSQTKLQQGLADLFGSAAVVQPVAEDPGLAEFRPKEDKSKIKEQQRLEAEREKEEKRKQKEAEAEEKRKQKEAEAEAKKKQKEAEAEAKRKQKEAEAAQKASTKRKSKPAADDKDAEDSDDAQKTVKKRKSNTQSADELVQLTATVAQLKEEMADIKQILLSIAQKEKK